VPDTLQQQKLCKFTNPFFKIPSMSQNILQQLARIFGVAIDI
jgi:hypothetical protein